MVWDMWAERLPKPFNPVVDVCVAEQLVPFKGQCEFRQFIPAKLKKYGIKLCVAADVATSYALKCQVDTGKDVGNTGKVPERESVVLDLMQDLHGATVTCNKSFTTYPLTQELLKRKIALVGAITRSQPELPPKLLDYKERAVQSSVFAFTKTTTAVNYISKGGKNMLFLSSKHRDDTFSEDNEKKPLIITDYKRCIGSVDKLEQV